MEVVEQGRDAILLKLGCQFTVHLRAVIPEFSADLSNLVNPVSPPLDSFFGQYFKGHGRVVFPTKWDYDFYTVYGNRAQTPVERPLTQNVAG